MTILIRKANGRWHEPEDGGYTSEGHLQAILLQHPSLVPGVDESAIACKEFQSGVGPADLIVLDREGSITIVECKLDANPGVRREIMGQVLDYASRLWKSSVEEFEGAWIRASADHQSPFTRLDDGEGRIRTSVAENLAVGRFNVVLAVDRLNADLKRIVEYLNAITLPTTGVIVVEFARAVGEGIEILIPQAYGTELAEAKSKSPASTRPVWTVEQYFDWCTTNDPEGAPAIHALVTTLEKLGVEVLGGFADTPSLNCGVEIPGFGRKYPVGLYTNEKRGALIEVRFSDFRNIPHLAKHLVDAVGAISGQPIPLDEVRSTGYGKRPNVSARDFPMEVIPQLATAVASLTQIPPIEADTLASE